MLELVDLTNRFNDRVDDTMLMLEERWQPTDAQIAVFVDCHAENRAAMLANPVRIIRAAAEQRNPKRRPTYNHALWSLSSQIGSAHDTRIIQIL